MTTNPIRCLLLLPLLAGLGCHRANFPGYPDNYRQFAYVANSAANTVTVLDLVYLRLDHTLRVGDNPSALALNPHKPEVYVLNRQSDSANGSLSIIDTNQNQVVATLPLQRDPSALSVDPSGSTAYVANSGSNSVSVTDLTTRQTRFWVHTSSRPTSALISPDGRTLLVTLPESGNVLLYAAVPAKVPGALASQTPITPATPLTLRATFPNCPGATSPVILPDSSKAFIACPRSNQVLVLALAADPASWSAKQDASHLQDRALALLDVGHNPTNLTMKPDGGEVFVSNADDGSISEIATPTNEVGSTFGIGNHPAHAVVSADNGALWIANSGADSVSLYSIDDGKLLPSLHAGVGPDALAFSADKEQRMLLAADRKSGDVAVLRTNSSQGPALFTILPAGADPAAIVVRSNTPNP